MKAVIIKIDLMQPVLVTALDGDPNSAVSFLYIPGSVLRGAAISAYMCTKKISSINSGDSSVRNRFFGGTYFLNAYLAQGESCRSLPPLLSWREKKHIPENCYDWAVAAPDTEDQWKTVGSHNFWAIKSATAEDHQLVQATPSLTLMVHTMRDRIYGRARGNSEEDEHGAVYRYQALSAGQSFIAAVLCETDEIASEMVGLLSGDFHLGGSRSAGYGHVRLTVIGHPVDHWREINQAVIPETSSGDVEPLPKIETKHQLQITFLSDGLFRNTYGQYSVDPSSIEWELARKLNCSVSIKNAFMGRGLVGGFNNKWGLPMPQTQTVRMGSVLVVEAPGCSTEALVKLEQAGLGDRREDGFGRVAINWSDAKMWQVSKSTGSHAPRIITFGAGSADEKLANMMLSRMLRQKLDAVLYREAADLARNIKSPSLSQMNQLAQACQDALQKLSAASDGVQNVLLPDLREQLKKQLNKLGKRKATASQYADLVNGRKILDWIETQIFDDEQIFETLLKGSTELSLGRLKAPLNPVLAFEYNLRLVSMVLRMAAKRKQQKEA